MVEAGEGRADRTHAEEHRGEARALTLTVMPAGRTVCAVPELTVLSAAARGGMTLPSSCRNGSCRACLCRLVAGTIHYRVEWPGVSRDEQQAGWMLPCIAYPESDITIEQPAMRETADIPIRPVRSRGF